MAVIAADNGCHPCVDAKAIAGRSLQPATTAE